jgi:hypothetical protein
MPRFVRLTLLNDNLLVFAAMNIFASSIFFTKFISLILYKATEQRLKIDINRLLFNTQDKLIAEITIVGVEQ